MSDPKTPRPVESEIDGLAARLQDSGMSEQSARTEAEQIVISIGTHYYAEGVQAGIDSNIPPVDVPRET